MEEDRETQIIHVDSAAVAALNKSEVESQLDAAHRYPRSVDRFLKDAKAMVTLTRAIASSCIYALPRGGKIIPGPSVRLAEISASAYGNLHVASRVVSVEERVIVAQGVAWDLEKNLRVALEVQRRITKSNGRRYDDDMIAVTGNAASSIARRNAIFGVIPRAYIDRLYGEARAVSVGDASTLAQRRQDVVQELMKAGVPQDRVLSRIGRRGMVEITIEDLEVLIGLMSAIENGEENLDKLFPPPQAEPGTTDLEQRIAAEEKAAAPPPPPPIPPTTQAAAPPAPAPPQPPAQEPQKARRRKPEPEPPVAPPPAAPAQSPTQATLPVASPPTPPVPAAAATSSMSPSPTERAFALVRGWSVPKGGAVRFKDIKTGEAFNTTTAGVPRVFGESACIEINVDGGTKLVTLEELTPWSQGG